jgi:anti-sigma B factor antagonist
MDFAIEKIFDGDCWRVDLSGEVDIFNSGELKNTLTQLMEEQSADLCLDCKNLEYIDSTGLGALVGVLKHIKSHGKEVRLLSVKPNILKLLAITNLDKVFIIEESDKDE